MILELKSLDLLHQEVYCCCQYGYFFLFSWHLAVSIGANNKIYIILFFNNAAREELFFVYNGAIELINPSYNDSKL